MDARRLKGFAKLLARKNIEWHELDAGDGSAGYIRIFQKSTGEKTPTIYRMLINQHHSPVLQFATLAHELAHLFLGNLGVDHTLKISHRPGLSHADRELEAESVAYLICARNGIHSASERYLADFVTPETNLDRLDLYAIMRTAGQIEALLGLTAHTQFEKPQVTTLQAMPLS
ncbi:MAG: ImmA/IrrE family metallo-endopeptidase [Proteobacteria bacterium]|nr:ImmA/IrrE family metallo-endopeptidase [Pseudomonadota bacterium]